MYSNRKLKDLKFKNKNLDKIRKMISSEIEEKFINIQPSNKNIIKNSQQKENKRKSNNILNNNINIYNNINESENEELEEEEIDDLFIELL